MAAREECAGRIARLQARLTEQGLDGALLVYPIDVYYYVGTRQIGTLWVPATGEPLLLVRKSLIRAREEAAIDDVRPFPSSKEFAACIPVEAAKIGMMFDVTPMQQHAFYAKLLAGREFVDISAINRELRSVKSVWELARMREAGAMLSSVFAKIPDFLQRGMREVDLAAEFECALRKAGNEGNVRMRAFNQDLFLGLAVAGAAAGQPGFFDGPVTGKGLTKSTPFGASADLLPENLPIVMDYTNVYQNYTVDMTRIFVLGDLPSELKEAYEVAIAIQNRIAAELKPGAICEELFFTALRMAEDAGLAANFMGAPGENAKFVGHGVGLELDEFPVLAQGFKVPLIAGQTIAIEPKFLFPGLGAVGIENTFAVTPDGGERLTTLDDGIVYL